MIEKLLIANRGEIAIRIARTCRRLGITTVAVYSEPDARSLHLEAADDAVALGGSTASESYLVKDKIIEAARRSGSRAIHPGYGFLSENPDFARMVLDAGLVFVGPPPEAMALLGEKIAAKRLAHEAGVPTIPGSREPIADAAAALEVAAETGYPVLLKAAAGGGGRGMRVVTEPEAMTAAVAACEAEAVKAFGDDRVFLERCIARPRHVEIQILADGHGNVIHLGERECSIQRRHQKIIEEAPSAAVDAGLRERMGRAACELAVAAGYANAGTVEFLLDEQRDFYFLEMNARLQVEHPVTELVTGLDLVELQLRIAAGEPLPFRQEDVRIHGWAIEARICAEEPERAFLPSTGTISRYAEPRGRNVRVDSGVEAGSRVSVYYDSMLAKVSTWGESREAARLTLVDALNGYHIEGLATNVDYANAILNHPAFTRAELSTDFIPAYMESAEGRVQPPLEHLHDMVIATVLVHHNRRGLAMESLKPMSPTIGGVTSGGSLEEYMVKAGTDVFRVRLRREQDPHRWSVWVDEREFDVVTPDFEFYRRRLKLLVGGSWLRFQLNYEGNFIRAAYCGIRRTFEIYSPREWQLAAFMPEPREKAGDDALVCPMPGLVVDVLTAVGERVHAGQVLLVLESMKMETGVPSPCTGEVRELLARKGQAVEVGDVLIRFSP